MTVLLLLAALVGYLAGALSPATLIAARRGVDLREVGSGNPGATNAGRVMGRRTGLTVAGLDVLKGLVPAVAFGAVDHRAGLLAGFAAVLGHVTSPFLRGRGGKGVATAAGAILGAQPLWAPVVLLVWVAVLVTSRWIALASVAAALSVLGIALVRGEDVLWAFGLAAVILVRHRANLTRRLALRRAGEA
ncbi:MAG: glycerol-3-phosphate acyltransferase [Actinobacteria bacterium]|nr:glycerol-3-phosphate acyltransferase [Actinomycetota bacterium]